MQLDRDGNGNIDTEEIVHYLNIENKIPEEEAM
jgi:Ca2+-binding EF-hand superfamily protein